MQNSGFTLTELLITLALIGILVAALLPNLFGARRSGEEKMTREYLSSCLTAAEQRRDFHSNTVTLPGSCTELAGPSPAPLQTNTITLSQNTYTITLTDRRGKSYTEKVRQHAE